MNGVMCGRGRLRAGLALPGGVGGERAAGGDIFADTDKNHGRLEAVGWKLDATKFGVPKTKFYVEPEESAEDKQVLVIDSKKATGCILYDLSDKVDLQKTPIMRWRWRVKTLPDGADGRDEDKDDQAVAIYIGTNALLGKRSIAYRWETDTPKDYAGEVKYAGGLMRVKYFVVENKETPAGEWVTEERNVAEDFKAAYGSVPKKFAISVCGNSQYTKTDTRAEIDYIEFVAKSDQK